MFKVGDKIRIKQDYYDKLLKSPRISDVYRKTRQIGVISKINGDRVSIKGKSASWNIENIELDKEDNEI